MVRPVRVNTPQVSNASLAEPVVTFQGDGVPGQVVAQRTDRRSVQRCAHFVLADVWCLFPRQAAGAGLNILNPAPPPSGAFLKGTVELLQVVEEVFI